MAKQTEKRYVFPKFANREAVFALCEEIDARTCDWQTKMRSLGLTMRGDARVVVTEWASVKYKVPAYDGQRGVTLDANHPKFEAAKKAINRVLDVCFPKDEAPKAKSESDPIAKLVKAYEKLTAAQKRSFKAKIGA